MVLIPITQNCESKEVYIYLRSVLFTIAKFWKQPKWPTRVGKEGQERSSGQCICFAQIWSLATHEVSRTLPGVISEAEISPEYMWLCPKKQKMEKKGRKGNRSLFIHTGSIYYLYKIFCFVTTCMELEDVVLSELKGGLMYVYFTQI